MFLFEERLLKKGENLTFAIECFSMNNFMIMNILGSLKLM
jgi:hypothetical protein